MLNQIRPLFALLIPLGLSGCVITTAQPQLRFETPETRHAPYGAEVLLTSQMPAEVVLIPNTLATPPVTNAPQYKEATQALGLKAGMGLSNSVDLYLRTNRNSAPVIGAKFELLEGAAPISILLGGGFGNSDGTDEGGTVRAGREIRHYAVEAGVVAGYRINENLLPYAALYYARSWAAGLVTQDPAIYAFNGKGNQTSANLGLQLKLAYFDARLEAGKSFSAWETARHTDTFAGLSVGVSW